MFGGLLDFAYKPLPGTSPDDDIDKNKKNKAVTKKNKAVTKRSEAVTKTEVKREEPKAETEEVKLKGIVERVVFHAQDSGYTVLEIKPEGAKSDLDERITAVGNLPDIKEGDEYLFTGKWRTHRKYGKQFQVNTCELLLPATRQGAIRYLATLTYGVGPGKARKIVDTLGDNALEVIKENPAKLNDLDFLSKEQREEIAAKITENEVLAELSALICREGITPALAAKIVDKYGGKSIEVVTTNPYILADDLWGVGFKKADTVAAAIGIEKDSPFRIKAAVKYLLNEAGSAGHCYLRPRDILAMAKDLLDYEVEVDAVSSAVDELIESEEAIREGNAVYAEKLYWAEVSLANKVRDMAAYKPAFMPQGVELEKLIDWSEKTAGVEYAEGQRSAVRAALQNQISVITGGPGTGKTTVIKSICEIVKKEHLHSAIYLAAPTGRAAQRMEEATGFEASTIHRLLKYNPMKGGFTHNMANPLAPGLVIIDEASMMDVELARDLFAAFETTKHQVVLVGDVDQLPSVGPGSVLRDIIRSKKVTTTRLQFNYRQAGGSEISRIANELAEGKTPPNLSTGDYEYIGVMDDEQAAKQVFSQVRGALKRGMSAMNFQVLAPMRKGKCGIIELNKHIRDIVNPWTKGTPTLGRFRLGDKIMVIRNDYDLEVFNGQFGIVKEIRGGVLIAAIDGVDVTFQVEDLEILTLAYAATIHKCVALDTLIETDEGLIRINEADKGFVASIDGVHAYTRTSTNPEEKMYCITTEDGYRLTVTAKHGMDSWNGKQYVRREAQNLSVGDFVRIGLHVRVEPLFTPRLPEETQNDVREQVFRTPDELSKEAAEFFGLMVADGTNFKRGFRLAKRHKEVVDRFSELCETLFGVAPKRWFRRNVYYAEVASTFLSRWITKVGGMEPNEKAVPDCILRGSSEMHCAFLRGLFEDGAVNLRTNNEDYLDHIELRSSREPLIADVQVMLVRLGIVSNHVRNVQSSGNGHSVLYIYGEYATIFSEKIGFITPEKQRRCGLKAGKPTRYLIPTTFDEAKKLHNDHPNLFLKNDRGNVRDRGHMSKYKASLILEAGRAPRWLRERMSAHHTRVASIERVVTRSTCLNVPDGHRFLQNGFSGWNSQGSEFPLVIMPLIRHHYIMLQRNLLYTGMTRAKDRLVLISDGFGVKRATQNNEIKKRFSLLAERINIDTD